MALHNDLGKRGELYAQNYLKNHGYQIIQTNYRYKHKEVDIIAKDENEIVFVEVKTRSEHTTANDVITNNKINYLREAADDYMRTNDLTEDLRFDVFLLYCRGENYQPQLIKAAFR